MNWVAFSIIILLALVAIGMILLAGSSTPAQAWDEAERLARLTFKQAKRIVILVLGVTIIVVGIVMIVAPGPAILVIPLGLAILASEFIWARRLLARYKSYAQGLARRVGKAAPWTPKPWMVVVVLTLTAVAAALAYFLTTWPRHWITSVASSLLIMEAVTLYLTITMARPDQPANNAPARGPLQGDVKQ
jgi:hypothetical protein